MTPKPTDRCGHDNCQKPYSEHVELLSADGSENEILCPDFLTADNRSQRFTPAPEPTKEEPSRRLTEEEERILDFCSRTGAKHVAAQHQEPQTPTGHPFLSELSKEELIEHLNQRNHEVVDLKLELSQLREEIKGWEESLPHTALVRQNRELKEENERLKALTTAFGYWLVDNGWEIEYLSGEDRGKWFNMSEAEDRYWTLAELLQRFEGQNTLEKD